jgi:hypothetical protein
MTAFPWRPAVEGRPCCLGQQCSLCTTILCRASHTSLQLSAWHSLLTLPGPSHHTTFPHIISHPSHLSHDQADGLPRLG